MNKIKEKIEQGENYFGTGSKTTPAFDVFTKDFKKALQHELKSVSATGFTFSRGHFYISGFFKVKDQIWYFSISDVRWTNGTPQLLYRTAEHYRDFTGGANRYVNIEPGMVEDMRLTI